MSARALVALRVCVAAAACAALFATGVPHVMAAPATDSQGYVDSTARCASPDSAVAYGSTEASRVAICKTPAGTYSYRGVRLRDGAKLILPATASGSGFTATNDGVTYGVTANALTVRSGSRVLREEPMVDFHGDLPTAPAAPTAANSSTPAPAPLPPPLPAEVGGG